MLFRVSLVLPPQSLSPAEITAAVLSVQRGERGRRAALATVIERSGSAPQVTGAKLLLLEDGQILGTVGGGAIEAKVIDATRRCLLTGRSQRVAANLVRDLGMCCGGSMEIFVEYINAQQRLILIGAGHVAQAIALAAQALDYRIVVIDDREDMLAHPHFERADRRMYDADEMTDALQDINAQDFVVIATRDHPRDETALAQLLAKTPVAYLGMIGSRRKVITVMQRILRRFDERNLPRPSLDHVRAPIGLALRGRTPAEIAISVLAELIAIQNGGDGKSMTILSEILAKPPTDSSSKPRPT